MKGRFSRIFELWNQRNTEYYQQAFSRLEKENKTTFNWAAALFGASWMVFRKMYGWAMLYICLYGSTFLLPSVLCDGHTKTMVFFVGCLALFIGFGFFGNTIYYKTVKSKISKGYKKIESYKAIDPVPPLILFVYWFVFLPFLCLLPSENQVMLLCTLFEPIVIAVFWAIDYKKYHKQESVEQEKVDEESVNQYLNKDNPKYLGVALAGVFACCSVVSGLCIIYVYGSWLIWFMAFVLANVFAC